MKKLNKQICCNCGKENYFYSLNCSNCKHYLRSVQPNIDFWNTSWQLFDSPQNALKKIIFAEHKNFSFFLLLLISVKIFLYTITIQSLLAPQNDYNFKLNNTLIFIGITFITIIVFIYFITFMLKTFHIKTRFKDNLSLLAYSSIPIIIASLILIPIEYGIFGQHWFIYNPSPFNIKPLVAYMLLIFEMIMFIWSMMILFYSFYIQSNSILWGLVNSIIIVSLITVVSNFLFNNII